MTLMQWFTFFLLIQVIHGLGTWKLYVKAGHKSWSAFIPVYNAIKLMQIINRPWWWTILLFVPIVNLIMFPVVWVETARSFGKNSLSDTFLAVITLGFYSYYINYVLDVKHIENRDLHPKSALGDWVSSILFAIVAATIVHTYFMQPFTIPTSSLEKTLLVGDFLFVSKIHYGPRIPMTTIAAPMVHDTIPVAKVKSYLSWPELPYLRLPGFQKIKRNEIVVFNWPVDTMLDMRHTDKFYYKPIDKRTNYVKRCVGIPGDTLSIKHGYVYINGKQNILPDRARLQFFYTIETKSGINQNFLNTYGITEYTGVYSLPTKIWEDTRVQDYFANNNISLQEVSKDSLNVELSGNLTQEAYTKLKFNPSVKLNVNLTDDLAEKMKKDPNVVSIKKYESTNRDLGIFPMNKSYNWNNDNFGPLYIPEKDKTINLTLENLPLYKRIITVYEGHTIKIENQQILIDNQPTTTYTFAQDYYWMMGDNRHNSQDSRVWGFVPFNHVVGKPVFVWMSWDSNNNPRWERWFTTVKGSGKPVSYLIPFLIVLAGWFGFNKWRKHKKAK